MVTLRDLQSCVLAVSMCNSVWLGRRACLISHHGEDNDVER